MTRARSAAQNLGLSYKQLTHGGNFWTDQYLLRDWHECKRAVVHRGEEHHGYKLQRRLGDSCWLTKHPATGEYLTVKFLSQGRNNELKMRQFLTVKCSSPFISKLTDYFTIRHHLATIDPKYKDIKFDAIVYQTTGSDLRRESATGESLSPPSLTERVRCIRQVIMAVAELHRLGVVHGGNVALAPPAKEDIERLLEREPQECPVVRKDGTPTPKHLPRFVTEPESIGFGDGNIQLLDFEYSFRLEPGVAYGRDAFARGTPPPPELIGFNKTTTNPLKVDSWQLGQLIYFILVDGCPIFRLGLGLRDKDLREQYNQSLGDLHRGEDEIINELPTDVSRPFTRIIRALLDEDPHHRLSIEDIDRKEDFHYFKTSI